MFKKIINSLSKWETIHLVMLPIVIGVLIIVVSLGIGGMGSIGNRIGGLLFPLGFFAWGFSGLPVIIRKEVPWLITVRGWIAVLQGVFIMLAMWVVTIILLIVMLRSG